jgi:acetolactate synthase-1/2/3 large subunit
MKLSDYVASFFEENNINDVFVLTGGCVVHLIDSIASKEKIQYIPVQHEQAGAMAADCYSRITKNIGAVIATSGPGATNLLTGICCSYYDSIPVLAITGQVPKGQLKRRSKSRQIGFQETDVVSIFKSVTKYSKLIDNPSTIRYELEKALYIAKSGRPGPVLLDICDDVQRSEINPSKLKSFTPPILKKRSDLNFLNKVVNEINKSKRPLLVLGAGVRLSGFTGDMENLIKIFNIPFTLTWGAADMVRHSHNLYVGNFGVTSGRAGNFAIQNADLIITIGTRLDTHEVGSNIKTFAREARKIVVDIDESEQEKYKKMGLEIDILYTRDAKDLMTSIIKHKEIFSKPSISPWLKKIKYWKKRFVACDLESTNQKKFVNPYFFIKKISELTKNNQIIVTDCGSNLIWTMQAFEVKKNSRLISAWNHSPMGYSLPASIGAAFAEPNRQVICISGDGGMQINIQELATIVKHNLNIKIFVVNNHCHGIIQGTQQSWLDSRFNASDPDYGKLPDPDFNKIAKAYGMDSVEVCNNKDVDKVLIKGLSKDGPLLINVHMKQESQIYPKLLFGKPIEDSHPLLERDDFYKQMIVKPIV